MTEQEWRALEPLEKIKAHMTRHGCDSCRYSCRTVCLKGLKKDLHLMKVWQTLDCDGWGEDTVDEDFIERIVRRDGNLEDISERCEILRGELHKLMLREEEG